MLRYHPIREVGSLWVRGKLNVVWPKCAHVPSLWEHVDLTSRIGWVTNVLEHLSLFHEHPVAGI
jgi:hypothetical protein